ncbi:GDSL-type esterase/lipase family protein [Polaribacter sp. Hel_I_88]|uniref:SGNH/GDSL hydrolase family protein n=1 Tax=Polaribacter sp. Hel_I_88 TaxID=1250006 RepID=UPI00068DE97C|nr:GDSL-type esterase/lipase family protein [Polaribacter sp. Hel_I_88]
MKFKILFFSLLILCSIEFTFGQDVILNNFEANTSNIVSRNGSNFAIVDNSSINQNSILMVQDFEPGSPNVVSRHGGSFSIVSNPNPDNINSSANSLKFGRTGTNWYELIAFPVTKIVVPPNTIKYLNIAVNFPAQPDVVIRVDGEDENSNGNPTVAIRAINKYTDYGNWGKLIFPLEGGPNGIEIKAIIVFPDAGFQNNPSGFILNNTNTFGYIDEISVSETDGSAATYEDYLTNIKAELVKNWPSNRTINLVFHGHSVPSGYYQTPTVNTLSAYPHQVLQKLSAKYPTAVINTIKTSIGGENSIQGARRFDEDVLVHKPDVLFIDYSLNDRSQGLAPAYAAWDEMIKKAIARGIKVILLTPSPVQNVNMLATDTELYQHTEQVKRLAQENGVALVDSYEQFKQEVINGNNVNNYLSSGNHPNTAGHTLIANEILKFF